MFLEKTLETGPEPQISNLYPEIIVVNDSLPQAEENKDNSRENIIKSKQKKVTKTNKTKKDEVLDRTYVLDLENQINTLQSTIDLFKKRNTQNVNLNPVRNTQSHASPEE